MIPIIPAIKLKLVLIRKELKSSFSNDIKKRPLFPTLDIEKENTYNRISKLPNLENKFNISSNS